MNITSANRKQITLILVVCHALAFCDAHAKPLSGKIEKKEPVRVARPITIKLSASKHQRVLDAGVDSSQFQLNTNKLESGTGSTFTELKSEPLFGNTSSGIGKGFSSSASPIQPSSGLDSHPILPRTTTGAGVQLIIVRLTYHMLDEQNVFNACKMCHSLRSAGCDVILMLDKEATRIAARTLSTQVTMRKENRAQMVPPLIERLLSDGVRVVASSDWAEDYSINSGNAINGIEFLATDQMAAEIVKSSKILEY